MIVVACAGAMFALIKLDPALLLVGIAILIELGLLVVFESVSSRLELESKKSTWPIIAMPIFILLCIALAFCVPVLIVLALVFLG